MFLISKIGSLLPRSNKDKMSLLVDPFIVLPKECVFEVLRHLPVRCIFYVFQVSKCWKDLTDDERFWQLLCQRDIKQTKSQNQSWKIFYKEQIGILNFHFEITQKGHDLKVNSDRNIVHFTEEPGIIFGDKQIPPSGRYYWEISGKGFSNFFVGVATRKEISNLNQHASWQGGILYNATNGYKTYANQFISGYGPIFQHDEENTIGILVDVTEGTITFYHNRKCLGVAFNDLHMQQDYFPIVGANGGHGVAKIIEHCEYPADIFK